MDKCETCKHYAPLALFGRTERRCHSPNTLQPDIDPFGHDHGRYIVLPEGFGCTFHELNPHDHPPDFDAIVLDYYGLKAD